MVNKMWGDYETKFASLRALYGYQFAHPGKKLNFMGGEFAQFIEWNYKQQLDWNLLEFPMHDSMRRYFRDLGRIYESTPALWRIDDSWDGFKWLNVDDNEHSSVAFMRMSRGSYIVCALNFTPVKYDSFTIGLPKPGVLRENELRRRQVQRHRRDERERNPLAQEGVPRLRLLRGDHAPADELRVLPLYPQQARAEAQKGGRLGRKEARLHGQKPAQAGEVTP